MAKSLGDVLSGGDWVKAKEFVGQTVIVERFEVRTGRTPDGNESRWPIVDVLTGEGEPAKISGTGNMLRQLEAIDHDDDFEFPLELKIVSFKTQFGGTGYGFEDPDA